jgi:hypothetical protein
MTLCSILSFNSDILQLSGIKLQISSEVPTPLFSVTSASLSVRYESMTSYITPEVIWGEIGSGSSEEWSAASSPQSPGVGDKSWSRRSGGGGRGSGSGSVLLYQSSSPQSPTGSHRPPFSSPAPPSPHFDLSHTPTTTSTSPMDKGGASSAGKSFDIPIEFVWKSVSGILVLGLSPCSPNPDSVPLNAKTDLSTQYSPSKFGINLAGENSDKGRKMVTAILQSLAKSAYDMYKSDKKRKLLILQKETIKKLRYAVSST